MKLLRNLLDEAQGSFSRKDYGDALLKYSLVLADNPSLKEAKIGAILTEMAVSGDVDNAHILFDYYMLLKMTQKDKAEEIIQSIIGSIDDSSIIGKFVGNIKNRSVIDKGVSYSDFKNIIKIKNSFKEAIESVIFSTFVVIENRGDFAEFLELLIDGGFNELAMKYLDNAIENFPNDEKLVLLYNKIAKKRVNEDKNR